MNNKKIEVGKLYKVNLLNFKEHDDELYSHIRKTAQREIDQSISHPNVYLILDETESGYKTLHWDKVENITKKFAEEYLELINTEEAEKTYR